MELFNLIISGRVSAESTTDAAINAMVQAYHSSQANVSKLINGVPKVLFPQIDLQAALQHKRFLDSQGIENVIRSVDSRELLPDGPGSSRVLSPFDDADAAVFHPPVPVPVRLPDYKDILLQLSFLSGIDKKGFVMLFGEKIPQDVREKFVDLTAHERLLYYYFAEQKNMQSLLLMSNRAIYYRDKKSQNKTIIISNIRSIEYVSKSAVLGLASEEILKINGLELEFYWHSQLHPKVAAFAIAALLEVNINCGELLYTQGEKRRVKIRLRPGPKEAISAVSIVQRYGRFLTHNDTIGGDISTWEMFNDKEKAAITRQAYWAEADESPIFAKSGLHSIVLTDKQIIYAGLKGIIGRVSFNEISRIELRESTGFKVNELEVISLFPDRSHLTAFVMMLAGLATRSRAGKAPELLVFGENKSLKYIDCLE